MIYTTDNISNIDFTKYKRFFAFGCSFTNYRWPTWADLISQAIPNATYYNLGKSGAGQEYICATVMEAIKEYDINSETDLVVIMWSTFFREDRLHFNQGYPDWCTPGNLYTQAEVELNKFHNPVGLCINSLVLIEMMTCVLKNSNFDSIAMWSLKLEDQLSMLGKEDPVAQKRLNKISKSYEYLDNFILPDIYGSYNKKEWPTRFTYTDFEGNLCQDYHPSTSDYYGYLKYLNMPLPEELEVYALEADKNTARLLENIGRLPFLHEETVRKFIDRLYE